jgi:hypothetical protein
MKRWRIAPTMGTFCPRSRRRIITSVARKADRKKKESTAMLAAYTKTAKDHLLATALDEMEGYLDTGKKSKGLSSPAVVEV